MWTIEPAVDTSIDVVIRTAGRAERLGSLTRAIASVVDQRGVAARPVVVITGERPGETAALASGHGARVHVIGKHVAPGAALRIGRNFVDARFYAFLDDDDQLLPDALRTRLDILHADSAVDVVVTTGYWISGNRPRLHIPDIARHQDQPLNGIIERCWLASCGGLFRTSSTSTRYFDDLPDLCEWTCLAFRLALDRLNIHFLDVPTYNVYDTPGSASKSSDYIEATLRVLEVIRVAALSAEERSNCERKYRSTLHDAAEHYRRQKDLLKAWRYHLKSMKPPHLLRYGAYTRKLLWKCRTSAA